MEKSFVVIVDSLADFEIGYSNPNLVIVPVPVFIGGEDDYTNVTPDEFYAKQKEIFAQNEQLRRSGQCPVSIKTSAPNIEDIRAAMVKILESGRDAIYVASASTLTSAFNSGRIAVQMIEDEDEFENKAIVIDGLSMSSLTAVLVKAALRDCDTTDEFVRYIFDRRNDTEHLFMVSEWDAFRDSGRIPAATLAFATIARIKPLMRFDFNDEGIRKAFAEKKSMSLKSLMKHAVDLMEKTIDDRFCMVIHADNQEGASMLHNMINERIPDVITTYHELRTRMGPATGVHLGYTAIGLAFLRKKELYPNAEFHRRTQIPEEAIYGYAL